MIYICSCNTWVCHLSNLSCLFKVIIQHKKVSYLENFPTYMLNTTTNNYNELLNPTDTPRWIDVDSTWILRRRPNFEEFPRNFHLFFRCNFAGRKSTSFPRTFFDVISMIEKSMLFPRTLLGLILMVEKSTLFPRTFVSVIRWSKYRRFFHVLFWCNFDGRKIHSVSMHFFWCNFFGRKIHVACRYFFRQNFEGQKFDVAFAQAAS